MAIVPPALCVVQIAPVGIALALPGEPALADPLAPEDVNVIGRGRKSLADPARCIIDI